MKRRQYLALLGSGLTLTVAGCVGGGDDDGGSDGGNGDDDGGSDGGNGGDDVGSDGGGDDDNEDTDPSSMAELQSIASTDDYFDPDAVELSGSGETVSDPVSLREGFITVDYDYQGGEEFSIDGLDGPIESDSLPIVYTGPAHTPIEAVQGRYINNPGEYKIEVVGDGEWSLVIAEPDTSTATVPTPPVSASGTGPDIVGPVTLEGDESVTATYDGPGPFTVSNFPERSTPEDSYAMFEQYSFDGEKTSDVGASGRCWIVVVGYGEWNLVIE